jgi:pilus assembly protein CpaF
MNATIEVRVTLHGERVEALEFSQPVIRIGRELDEQGARNDIVLASKGVSRSHAQLIIRDGAVTVIDRSRHGTFVNGERLREPRQLGPGDVIEIDAYSLHCGLAGAEASMPAGPRPAPETTAPELDLVPPDDELPSFDAVEELKPAKQLAPAELRATALPARSSGEVPGESLPIHTPSSMPASPPVVADRGDSTPAPEHSLLAIAYRELAALHGAARWGQPARLDRADLPRTTETARRLLVCRAQQLPSGIPWPEWLARELCGRGPLDDLLDDIAVTTLTVRGATAIHVRRGEARERAATRFSCAEALHAVVERWTGQRLGDLACLEICPAEGISVLALGRGIVPGGPVVHVTRTSRAGAPRLTELVAERVLSQAAADLLAECVRRGLGILVHGDATADLSTLTRALVGACPAERSIAVVRRAGNWDADQALVLAGERPGALAAARRLDADWLVIEEVEATDAADLCGAARHPGGGTIVTLRARSAEAAITRLAAMFAAASGWPDQLAARAVVTTGFDVFVGLRRGTSGTSVVYTLAEPRPGARGELAELFTWKPDVAALEPTGVEIHLFR